MITILHICATSLTTVRGCSKLLHTLACSVLPVVVTPSGDETLAASQNRRFGRCQDTRRRTFFRARWSLPYVLHLLHLLVWSRGVGRGHRQYVPQHVRSSNAPMFLRHLLAFHPNFLLQTSTTNISHTRFTILCNTNIFNFSSPYFLSLARLSTYTQHRHHDF